MRPPAKITQEVLDRINKMIPLFNTQKEVAEAANVTKDSVWSVVNENYVVTDKAEQIKASDDGDFSWSEYPNGLY